MSKNTWIKYISEKHIYFIAIATIAVLTLANQFIIQKLLQERRDDAVVINLAGRQRMLSQKIVSLSYQAKDDPTKVYLLQAEVENWNKVQEGLQKGSDLYRLPGTTNLEILQLFDNASIFKKAIVELVRSIETVEDIDVNRSKIAANADQFLPIMDQIVNAYQLESEEKVQALITLEFILAALSLLILFFEIQFIFKPILSDISKKRKALEKLNLSKDRIMATVVHDLRSPISGIQGLVNILKKELEEHLSDDQEVMFDLIDDSCNKTYSLIQELLDMAILESNEYHLETERTHLGQYLMSTLARFKTQAEEKGVTLVIEEKDDVLTASIDQEKFARVMDNLISNALKFTGSSGVVKVEASQEDDEQILVKVIDSGIGIPKEMQSFIFDKFSKARRLGLEGERTTGLGMSIVKQIVELHNGQIWVESKEGKGTSFYISLPKVA